MVHSDGKLLIEITRIEKVESLPVIISANGQEHLLGVPKLASSSGDYIAIAVHNLLIKKSYFLNSTRHILLYHCFKYGKNKRKGAEFLENYFLCLPFRHHIYELVLKPAFKACIAKSSRAETGFLKQSQ